MKKIFYGVVIVIMCSFTSCNTSNAPNRPSNNELCSIEGYTINNSPIELKDYGYHIKELQNFFGEPSLQKNGSLYLADIDGKFPIKYLRKAEKFESYYIVYPVFEGGKFLVFLNTHIDFEINNGRLMYSESLYIHNLPTRVDLSNLKSTNTYDDLKDILPCTVLNTTRSSSIDSYSILNDGWVLRCTYSRSTDGKLHIENKEIISYDDPQFPFSGVIYSDLMDK